MDNTDLIEDYLNGLLSPTDQLAFEADLQKDNALSEELELHKRLRSFVKENEVQSLKFQVKDWLSEEGQEEEETKIIPLSRAKPSSTFNTNYIFRIAAVLMLVSGVGWYFISNNAVGNETQFLSALSSQNPEQLQGVADNRTAWTQAYRDKNYQNVIDFLSKKTEQSPEEVYYLGLSYVVTEQYEKAIEQFTKKSILDSVYVEKANWALALVYLKQKKDDLAKPILEKIAKSDSEFSEKAKELL